MKQNTKTAKTRSSVIKTTERAINNDGYIAYSRDTKAELFLLGAGRFYDESTFYSEGNRFVELVRSVTQSDPVWVAQYLNWLRNTANIRTSAIVGAAEYVVAGGPNGRSVVKSVLVRADEPAELLAYWINTYGKAVPQPIKRGIRDSAQRLYNERNFARWDSKSAGVRMADVVELTHPKPSGPIQSDLFKYMLEDRRGRGNLEGKALDNLIARSKCESRDDYLKELVKGNPTISWENVSSAGSGAMTADDWVSLYPRMGYMAQLRNLNNLDKAGVDLKIKYSIGAHLADPNEVAKSKQLPLRFYSAYKNVSDDAWKSYLSTALDHSLANVPKVRGKWLVLVDASGSMWWEMSKKSNLNYYETATVFGAAFAKANDADIRTYSNSLSPVLPTKGKNTMRIVRDLSGDEYAHRGGTSTAGCLAAAYAEHKYDGVLLLTDEQYNGSYYGDGDPSGVIPKNVPLYTFNLAGYQTGHFAGPNRITVGGLSDAAFSMIANAEGMRSKWPWE